MTELPNEWIDKASNISNTKLKGSTNERQLGYEDGFTDGATAYKQAVEKLLSDEAAVYKKAYGEQYDCCLNLLNEMINKLQTLKPTSNE
jgi:hypothetical protein